MPNSSAVRCIIFGCNPPAPKRGEVDEEKSARERFLRKSRLAPSMHSPTSLQQKPLQGCFVFCRIQTIPTWNTDRKSNYFYFYCLRKKSAISDTMKLLVVFVFVLKILSIFIFVIPMQLDVNDCKKNASGSLLVLVISS